MMKFVVDLIHSTKQWNAEVIYGDTDSVFVRLKGIPEEKAFLIGSEIAKTVTEKFPSPIELKFEKLYLPLVLLAKKRYVGFKKESISSSFVLDAKGIETVRRDGSHLGQRVMRDVLQELFESRDLSKVKKYLLELWGKIE